MSEERLFDRDYGELRAVARPLVKRGEFGARIFDGAKRGSRARRRRNETIHHQRLAS